MSNFGIQSKQNSQTKHSPDWIKWKYGYMQNLGLLCKNIVQRKYYDGGCKSIENLENIASSYCCVRIKGNKNFTEFYKSLEGKNIYDKKRCFTQLLTIYQSDRKKNVTKMVSNEWNDLHDPKINIRLKHFIHKNTISLSNDDPTMISLLLVIVQILTHVDEDSAKTGKKRVLYSTTRWRTYAHKKH